MDKRTRVIDAFLELCIDEQAFSEAFEAASSMGGSQAVIDKLVKSLILMNDFKRAVILAQRRSPSEKVVKLLVDSWLPLYLSKHDWEIKPALPFEIAEVVVKTGNVDLADYVVKLFIDNEMIGDAGDLIIKSGNVPEKTRERLLAACIRKRCCFEKGRIPSVYYKGGSDLNEEEIESTKIFLSL